MTVEENIFRLFSISINEAGLATALDCSNCRLPLQKGERAVFEVVSRDVDLSGVRIALNLVHLVCPEADRG